MRRMFHHAVVLIAVFALVASAAAWRQCAGLQMAAAAAEHAEHLNATHSPGGHDHAAMHHEHGANDASPAAPAMDDHGCQKCCSMCMVANALLPATGNAVVLKWTSVTFAGVAERRTGSLVAVDPGIPKRIV
jgi:hypothetical protein